MVAKRHTLIPSLGLLVFCGLGWKAEAGTFNAPTEARIIDSFDQLGIDSPTPRFGWVDHAALQDRGERQTAYEIIVSSKEADIQAGRGTLWDSGKVASARQYGVGYAGATLAKTTKYWWKVRSWDKDDQPSPWSGEASFVTSFFQPGDWDSAAQWITAPESSQNKSDPLPLFRKAFQISKPVRNAYLYVTGLGQFVAFLNGSKVGNHEIDPAWTDYDRSVDYVTFDVTPQLKTGANVIGVMLGSGWLATHDNLQMRDFGPLRLRAQLHLEYTDGTSEELVSDKTWRTAKGPFTMTELHGAEDYDARADQTGWNTVDFDDSSWMQASTATASRGVLVAQSCPPVIVRQTFTPVKVTHPAPHHYVYDMGKNFNGIYSITVKGDPGSIVRVLAGEALNKDGTVNPGRSSGSHYTLKGGNEPESWRLTFSTLGFRYVELGDVTTDGSESGMPLVQEVKGYFTTTAADDVGTFTCSDERDNKICDMAMRTIENNFTTIHTDGPNMEKLGWQEVAWLAPIPCIYQLDLQTLLTKIARDIRDGQRTSGLCSTIVPNWFYTADHQANNPFDDAPAWGASMFQVPWQTYFAYGDLKVLQDNYEPMKAYLAYLKRKESNGLVQYGLGDWMAPDGTNVPNVEGAIYVLDTRTMRDVARILDKQEDADHYSQEFDRVRDAYNKAYFKDDSNRYEPVTQADEAMPLALGIIPKGKEQGVMDALVAEVTTPAHPTSGGKNGAVVANHISAGDIGTTFVWQVLGDYGRPDLVQTLITQPDSPSYTAMLNGGETTVTENWNLGHVRSHDHDMYAGIGAWFYRSLAGISNTKPGYEEFQIKPDFSTNLTSVHCTYHSMRGLIGSEWERTNGELKLKVIVPVNSTAIVYIPAHDVASIMESGEAAQKAPCVQFLRMEKSTAVFSVGSGEYTFQSRLP